MKKGDSPLLQNRWKVRVGSARKLVWELYQFLVGMGYKCEQPYEALELKPTPIEGVATFECNLEGHKDFPQRSLWRLILGIILCFTILLIPVGVWLIKKRKYVFRDTFKLSVEGEAYRASARTQDPYRAQSEVLDIASNARIILEAEATLIRAGKTKKVENKSERERLEAEFAQLGDELDKLIPKIALPKATEDFQRCFKTRPELLLSRDNRFCCSERIFLA